MRESPSTAAPEAPCCTLFTLQPISAIPPWHPEGAHALLHRRLPAAHRGHIQQHGLGDHSDGAWGGYGAGQLQVLHTHPDRCVGQMWAIPTALQCYLLFQISKGCIVMYVTQFSTLFSNF